MQKTIGIEEPPSTDSGSERFNRFISWLQMRFEAPLPERKAVEGSIDPKFLISSFLTERVKQFRFQIGYELVKLFGHSEVGEANL